MDRKKDRACRKSRLFSSLVTLHKNATIHLCRVTSEPDGKGSTLTTEQVTLPSHAEVAQKIAEQLGETGKIQSIQLKHIVWTLGVVQAWALLLDALDIEEQGGMRVMDGSRRRTPGGVFFHLVYTKGVPEQGKKLKRFHDGKPEGGKPVQALSA